MTYNNQGHSTVNSANLSGFYFANAVSTLWLPGHQKVGRYTLINGSESMDLSVPLNVVQEFWPEINRKFFHRK